MYVRHGSVRGFWGRCRAESIIIYYREKKKKVAHRRRQIGREKRFAADRRAAGRPPLAVSLNVPRGRGRGADEVRAVSVAATVTLRRADCLFGELPRRGKYALPPASRARSSRRSAVGKAAAFCSPPVFTVPCRPLSMAPSIADATRVVFFERLYTPPNTLIAADDAPRVYTNIAGRTNKI